MKLTKHQLTGLWFLSGTLISVLIEFIQLSQPSSSFLSLIVGLISGAVASYYLGYHYGYLIIELPNWHILNWLKTLVYGWVISIATLFWILFFLALCSFLQTEFIERIADHQYWQIALQLVLLPIYSLLATIIGCALEPVLVLGVSALGALTLFLLRKFVIRFAQ
ncbi:MAG: hypothetical protein P4L79_15805 [Legionella sp.]|uniref:hypothetical protein n=1 Tax=Legionella sp. TaxID=459 RepID=UPI00284E6CD9|nr:hypothetical protein [Legionella sp.]